MVDRPPQQPLLDREPDFDVIALNDQRGGFLRRDFAALWLGCQQTLRIFMLRIGEQRRSLSGLHDFALTHHAYPVGDLAHDAEIMGDEQHRHAEFSLQIL